MLPPKRHKSRRFAPLEDVSWVCMDCGTKYGRHAVGVATWHNGECQVCGRHAPVTEPRDFGYLTRDTH